MAIYGAFSSAMLGMMSQTRALHNIGVNIANVNTGGYKATDTQFTTILSKSINNVSDNGGVRPVDRINITKQGNIVSSEHSSDIAISGKGFFVMNTKQDGTGGQIYGRDGSFEIQTANTITVTGIGGQAVTTKDGYLADKNGYFIQGWAYQNGAVSTTGKTQSLRVDQYAFIDTFQTTAKANLDLNLPAGNAVGGANTYAISVFDSTGAKQSADLKFTKTGVGTWNVATTTSRTTVAQVDTVTLGGSVGEAGDTYTATVNGNSVTYTTTGTETTLNDIRTGLITLLNSDTQTSNNITAAAGAAAGTITLTAKTAGNPLTTTVSAAQGPVVNVAQVDTLTVGGTIQVGDQYAVTVNNTQVNYTAIGGDTIASVRNALVPLITALPGVTAATGGAGQLTMTADVAGTAFTASASTPIVGSNADNTAVLTATTANVTALADNTAAVATTTANVTNSVTGAATALTFGADGTLTSPKTLNLALTFSSGSTATVALDISKMTQFYGDFLPINYGKDGFAKSSMTSFSFNKTGDVIGKFEDNTNRTIYKLALGVFSNPNALDSVNGNVYKPTNDSGGATITTAGANGFASILPNARELSNVDMAGQFTKMMLTQTAYNAASTVFKTTDEMLTVARDLKR